MKLAIGVPWTSPFIWTRHYETMMNLHRPTEARNALGEMEPLETRYFRGQGWCPARRHADICEQAVAWGADLILICGADQIHPEDMLDRLIGRWNDGHNAVAALVPARGFVGWVGMKPFQPVAWRMKPQVGNLRIVTPEQPEIEVIRREDGDLQHVDFIGSGVIMFHRDQLLALRKPWFSETFNPETMQRLASMDTTFSFRLQLEGGARIMVDTTIDVKHIHGFEIDETFSDRFRDWAEPGAGDPALCMFENPVEKAVS